MKITNDILKDYFYDKCSHEEEIEIQKWLTENDNDQVDQRFREIISEIQIEDRELSQKAFLKFQEATQPKQARTLQPKLRRTIRWTQRVAAVLFIPLLFLAGYLLLNKKANTHWNDITVPHGMQQTLTLSDGTKLHVNSGTRVIYPSDFTEDKREIFVSGELFADVAKDPDKPFIISAGDVHVQVLGTKFNLRAYENIETVEIALVEGSVLFKTPTHPNEILKKGAMTYKASLNITGGSTNTRYFVSASYVEEEGMYKTDKEIEKQYNTNANARRWNYRMNADIDITKSTLLNVGISGMLKKVNDTGRGSSLVWNSLMGQTPVSIPKVYSNGYFPASEYNENYRDNPWIASTQTGYRQNWTNQIQTNVTLNQKLDFITEGLKFIGRFGYDTNNSNYINKLKAPERWKAERFRDSEGNLVFKRLNEEQKMTQSAGGSGDRHEFFEAELHYNRVFNKHHHVGSVLKYNQDSKIRTYNLGDDLKNSVPVRHQGFSGRFTYNWKYRYFVNFNFGYTGSENFAVGNQFGFFPAFSMAWNIAEEPFIQNNFKWLNMFKVRYSWGKVGNDNVSVRFPYMYTIGSFKNYQWADFGFNQSYNGLTYTSVASNGISWEIAKKHDIGLDLVLFNERFSLTVDYFNEKRTGIFMSRGSLPLTVGLYDGDKPYANVGSVINRGWDGNFSFNQNIGNVSLTIRANATYSDNEILEKDEGHKLYPYLYETGFSVSQSRGLIALGLFKDWDDIRNSPTQNTWGSVEPGDIKYKDVNGDGVINNNDRVAVGNTNRPSFVYGMGISANWKGLDASVHFQGTGKSSFFINGVLVHPFSRGTWGNVSTDVVNSSRWISRDISGDPATENPNAVYPRLKFGGENNVNNNQYSTHWLRNGSYLRLKTVEIGYTLPKNIVSKIRFSKIRLFFTGTNLLTFSKFKLWDPEPRSNDGSFYPITKSVTFGLNISL